MKFEKMKQITNINALVFGDLMVDKYIMGNVSRISPEAPVPILEVKDKHSKLGGAGNVVNNIISLGAKASVLGCVGKDPDGEWIIDELENYEVCTKYIYRYEEVKSIAKTRLVSKNQQFLRFDEEIIQDAPESFICEVEENIEEILKDKHVVIISDYGKGTVTKRISQLIIKEANKRKIPVVVDPKGKEYSKYNGATVCTPNVQELNTYIGTNAKTEEEVNQSANQLLKEVDLAYLMLTRSEKGISLFSKVKNEGLHFPAVAKDVIDVTGAGDTVVSTIALLLATGFSMADCCTLANIAASIVCSKFGAATLTINEWIRHVVLSGEFKTISVDTAKYVVSSAKEEGKTVVFTNGCFDLLHAGHLSSFKQARALGDILVVAVNSDESVKRNKGDKRPIINQEYRIEMLCALEYIDYVILMEEDNPISIIENIQPDITVKGKDWEGKYLPEEKVVTSYGGKVEFINLEGSLSTTSIISKIKECEENE